MSIYLIVNKVNGKIYVGLTTLSINKRWKNHLKAYKHANYALYRAMRKYGIDNFCIEEVDTADSLDSLIQKESYWIKLLDSMNPKIGYNMLYQDTHLKVYGDEVRAKLRTAGIKYNSSLSKEDKAVISEKMSISRQGTKREGRIYFGVYPACKTCTSYVMEIAYKKTKYRMSFKTEIEAVEAYDKAALYLYGDEAKTNLDREIYSNVDLEYWFKKAISNKSRGGRSSKLPFHIEEMVFTLSEDMPQDRIASMFGVSQTTIGNILRRHEFLLKNGD